MYAHHILRNTFRFITTICAALKPDQQYRFCPSYALAVATQFAVFPTFGLRVGVVENLGLGLIFTAVSLARGYLLRRLFDRLHF